MSIQTKVLIGVGILGLGAYLAYSLMKKDSGEEIPLCPCTGQLTNVQATLIPDWLGDDEVEFSIAIKNDTDCINNYVVVIYDINYQLIHKSDQIMIQSNQSGTYSWDTNWNNYSAEDFCEGFHIEVYCETEPGVGTPINQIEQVFNVPGLVC